ncbi:dihydrodipicolinate synthase family protein [Peribacillus frigoritolerans]|nr:dihydrodipicolinate synthase family protein [Peribacillus frigoritolerans]
MEECLLWWELAYRIKEVQELTSYAEEHGANGILVVNPYYWKLSDEQLYRHFSSVANHTNLQVFIYNIPLLTGQNLSIELIKKISRRSFKHCRY